MYHCFYDDNKNLVAINTGNPQTRKDAKEILEKYGWRGQNNYGCEANSEKEAIEKAIKAGFKDVSAEKMAMLEGKMLGLKNQVDKFLKV